MFFSSTSAVTFTTMYADPRRSHLWSTRAVTKDGFYADVQRAGPFPPSPPKLACGRNTVWEAGRRAMGPASQTGPRPADPNPLRAVLILIRPERHRLISNSTCPASHFSHFFHLPPLPRPPSPQHLCGRIRVMRDCMGLSWMCICLWSAFTTRRGDRRGLRACPKSRPIPARGGGPPPGPADPNPLTTILIQPAPCLHTNTSSNTSSR